MDRTKEYILMSEKAEKYLPKWTHEDIDAWDYLHCKYSEYEDGLVNPCDILCGLDMDSWTRVYRQDQLQDMIIPNDVTNKAWYLISEVNAFIKMRTFDDFNDISMEQLWLAFVMKEKYSKIWNGKDWEKC